MRAAAALLPASLLWIFGELLERWIDWRGRGFGNTRAIDSIRHRAMELVPDCYNNCKALLKIDA
eukprot:scaffold5863_cov88-Skeletonema_marinoi.AAC.1